VNEVPLTTSVEPATPSVDETADVDDETQLVGVKWNGSNDPEFTIEVQEQDGTWTAPYPAEPLDGGADAGTAEADRIAARRSAQYITEPISISNAEKVRVRTSEGLVTDLELVTVGGGPAQPTGEPAPPPAETPTTATASTTTPPPPSSPPDPPVPPSTGPGTTEAAVLTWTGAGLLAVAALGWLALNRRRARRARWVVILAVAAFVVAACTPPGPPPPPETGIHSRAEWGGPNVGPCAGYQDPPGVTYAIVHHTGGGPQDNDYTDPAAKINGIYNYHVTSGGYCDIAYNFLIDKFGGVWEGRAGGVTNSVFGAHALGYNAHSTGIALLGDFTSVNAAEAAQGALVNLVAWKFSIHGVNPAGKPNNEIWGHRDVNATACPGNSFYPELPKIRSQVLTLMGV